jgi:predicted dehydrogenase
MRILQIGFGNFGPTHLQAWLGLGLGDGIFLADPDPAARERAWALGLPQERIAADHRHFLDRVDAVDIVAPLPLHVPLTLEALAAGRHVFLEKPACATSAEAEALLQAAASAGRVVQTGFFFRCHPLAVRAKGLIEAGALGTLRHLDGDFVGFKRARADSGVVENDAVHFLDLLGWLAGAAPVRVQALTRDHFGRGWTDLALVLLEWADGAIGRVEASWIQPGELPEPIVAGATSTKRVMVAGSLGALELDFQRNLMHRHVVHHELQDGLWRPCFGPITLHHGEPADVVTVVRAELAAFLDSIRTGRPPVAGLQDGALGMTRLIEAIHRSAAEGGAVAIAPS